MNRLLSLAAAVRDAWFPRNPPAPRPGTQPAAIRFYTTTPSREARRSA